MDANAQMALDNIISWSDEKCSCGLDHPDIEINDKVWNGFNQETMDYFKESVFRHFRIVGKKFKTMGYTEYPHILIDNDKNKLHEINELLNYVRKDFAKTEDNKLIITDVAGIYIGQTMHALGLAWNYFPHWTTVRCNNMRTPQETFEKDEFFRKVIDKRIKWVPTDPSVVLDRKRQGIGTMMTVNGIRKSIKMFTGTQAVSNFRPSAAAAVYQKLLLTDNSVVWDMSMGWGGRMLGALACDKVAKYIGCDPATDTFAGLEKMRNDLKRLVPERKIEYEIHCFGSEGPEMRTVLPESGVDLCFTSPPYFDCEKYSEEITQSWVKYKKDTKEESKDAWLYGFMKDTMGNCWHALKPGGVMAINIADVKSYKDMVKKLINLAVDEGWTYDEQINLRLALSASVGGVQYRSCSQCQNLTAEDNQLSSVDKNYAGNWKRCLEHKYKYEPILVFRKL